ncbi:MAG: TIGR02757 family protein [Bacteroidia bacterium]
MAPQDILALKPFLDAQAAHFNHPRFIPEDPVSIPHLFTKKQDIEIAGFLAAILAWGQRPAILRKCGELMMWMDHDPHEFMLHHTQADLTPFRSFRHRTFNGTDAICFIRFLSCFYKVHTSLEEAFTSSIKPEDQDTRSALTGFHEQFFAMEDAPQRTQKHIGTPARKSACKRLNMYLRWMVRNDGKGVDFGLWKGISPAQLVCPLDLHVDQVARELGLLSRKQKDWAAATELTANLKLLDPRDPVKYDFALFGMGVSKRSS